ncbi:MAG: Ldh family oxidoreductase [Thermofilaceae archaeon]
MSYPLGSHRCSSWGLSYYRGLAISSGLAFVVNVLCGVLTGTGYGIYVKHTTAKEPANVGHFMISINIDAISSLDSFLDRIEEYRKYVKGLRKISENTEIWLPGEKSWLTMETRKK